MLVDDNELDLMADPHTKADLGEGCVPIGRQFGLLLVKSSPSSGNVVGISIAPKFGMIMKCSLKLKQKIKFLLQ